MTSKVKQVGVLGGILASLANACVQVEVTNIRNSGVITDYMSGHDEIEMSFGISDLFYYTYANDYAKSDSVPLPSGAVSFPCFMDEAIWLQTTEVDFLKNDKTRIVIDCD